MAKTIAKSLHTVTVLANLAVYLRAADNGPVDQGAAHYVNRAADILGYSMLGTSDPHGLLGKATAVFARELSPVTRTMADNIRASLRQQVEGAR